MMYNNARYYIQSKYENNKFLRKLDFANQFSYTDSYTYAPNISDFPLNFSSLDSLQDFVSNTIFQQASCGNIQQIDSNAIQNYQNLKIVQLDKFESLQNFQCLPEVPNYDVNNLLEYVKKASFKVLLSRRYNPRISNYYLYKSNFNDRKMGYCNYSYNEFIIDINSDCYTYGYYPMKTRLSELGVPFNSNDQEKIITLFNQEDLNFVKISMHESSAWRILPEQELTNLEQTVSYQIPIPLY